MKVVRRSTERQDNLENSYKKLHAKQKNVRKMKYNELKKFEDEESSEDSDENDNTFMFSKQNKSLIVFEAILKSVILPEHIITEEQYVSITMPQVSREVLIES